MIDAVLDISRYQRLEAGAFHAMQNDGILAVIHKASQGTSYVDPAYADAKKRAGVVGMLFGAYHFGTSSNPVDQADHFLEAAWGTNFLVLDWEGNKEATMSRLQAEGVVQRIFDKTGVWPVLYSGQAFFKANSNASKILARCPFWIARYNVKPPTIKNWKLWQYTSEGRVKGIEGNVDRNRFKGTAEELQAWWKQQEGA